MTCFVKIKQQQSIFDIFKETDGLIIVKFSKFSNNPLDTVQILSRLFTLLDKMAPCWHYEDPELFLISMRSDFDPWAVNMALTCCLCTEVTERHSDAPADMFLINWLSFTGKRNKQGFICILVFTTVSLSMLGSDQCTLALDRKTQWP